MASLSYVVIPELKQILGAQPAVPDLSGAAAQNRFNFLFGQFIQVFITQHQPLVIFLDDLQWADAASLKLLKLLMQDDGHLLLIGAYRDNEVSPNHPLIATIEDIQAERKQRNNNKPSTLDAEAVLTDFGPDSGPGSATEFVPESLLETGPEMGPEMGPEFVSKSAPELLPHNTHVNILALEPLGLKDIKQFVADTLHSDMDAALPLAEIIYQKARGNPFFSSQILTALHAEGLITLAPSHRGWQYDLAKIHAATLTDNVVEFMGEQLLRLPADTQTALKIAACIGAQFDL
ncbi:MAG: AAA family ATPase, partial [Cyanobacteria bacterium P01_G01_bin.54]